MTSAVTYLVAPKSQNRVGGYQYYLGKEAGTQFNGPIYVLLAKVIKTVMGQDQQQKLKLVDCT
jgi:hypothetical protein